MQPVQSSSRGSNMTHIFRGGCGVEIEAAALRDVRLEEGPIVVDGLRANEVPQDAHTHAGILNISARSVCKGTSTWGFCVMLAGLDRKGGITWTCYLPGSHESEGAKDLLESVLVPPDVLGKTVRVWIRFAAIPISSSVRATPS